LGRGFQLWDPVHEPFEQRVGPPAGIPLLFDRALQVGDAVAQLDHNLALVARPVGILAAPWSRLVGVQQHEQAISLALVRNGAALDAATNGLNRDAECFGCVWDSEATATSVRPVSALVVASLHDHSLQHVEYRQQGRKP
jgi:hypothetical protein